MYARYDRSHTYLGSRFSKAFKKATQQIQQVVNIPEVKKIIAAVTPPGMPTPPIPGVTSGSIVPSGVPIPKAVQEKLDDPRVQRAIEAATDPSQIADNMEMSIRNPKKFLRQQSQITRGVHKAITPPEILKLEEKAKKALPKILPIVALIVDVVSLFFPILVPLAEVLHEASYAVKLYAKNANKQDQREAQEQYDRAKEAVVVELVNQGLDRPRASRIVDLIADGMDPEAAMRSVLGNGTVALTVPENSPLAAQAVANTQATSTDAWLSAQQYAVDPGAPGAPSATAQQQKQAAAASVEDHKLIPLMWAGILSAIF